MRALVFRHAHANVRETVLGVAAARCEAQMCRIARTLSQGRRAIACGACVSSPVVDAGVKFFFARSRRRRRKPVKSL
jgi:hypothetical protein